MSRKNVAYTRPDEPNFIKALKSKVGYKEPSTIDTKKELPQRPSGDSDDDEAREDEEPTIVVLKQGDITPEEYGKSKTSIKPVPSRSKASAIATDESSGKIEFKKPIKRQSVEGNPAALGASSSKKAKEAPLRKEISSKAVKDCNLLSFEDDEET